MLEIFLGRREAGAVAVESAAENYTAKKKKEQTPSVAARAQTARTIQTAAKRNERTEGNHETRQQLVDLPAKNEIW